jgi:hypothetical protein
VDRLDRRVVGRLLLLLLTVFLLTMAGRLTSGDGETVYQTTRALVLRRALAVPPRPETAIGRNGKYYGKYGLGLSLAQAPFLVAGELTGKVVGAADDRPARFAVGMTNSAVSAALTGLFWLLCRRLGAGRGAATAAALTLALASLVWPYARADFSEPLQALCLLATFYGFLRWRGATGAMVWPLAAGCAAGLAFLTKPAAVVTLAPLAGYFLLTLWERRVLGLHRLALACLAAGAPFAVAALLQLALNYYRFGSISEFGYGDEPKVGFTTPLLRGVQYLLLSSGKGLFLFAPPELGTALHVCDRAFRAAGAGSAVRTVARVACGAARRGGGTGGCGGGGIGAGSADRLWSVLQRSGVAAGARGGRERGAGGAGVLADPRTRVAGARDATRHE